jgi:cytoskeleton protein RodZ
MAEPPVPAPAAVPPAASGDVIVPAAEPSSLTALPAATAGGDSAAVPQAVAAEAVAAGAAPSAAPPAAAVPVAVTFLLESWLEVTDAGGARLFYGLGAPGRELALSGTPPFTIVAGNTAGLRLRVAGEEIALPNDAAPGNMARFTVGVPEPQED